MSSQWLSLFCFGLVTFAMQILHNVFLLYYVFMFRSVYGLNDAGFYAGQAIYLIWNSTNDSFFGILSDRGWWKTAQTTTGGSGSGNEFTRRTGGIRFAGPIYAAAFLAPFALPRVFFGNPWASFLHFVTAICLYDGFFSLVYVSQQALLADLSIDPLVRSQAGRAVSAALIAACVSVVGSHMVFDPEDLVAFRTYCVGLALLSAAIFYFATPFITERVVTLRGTGSSSSSSTATSATSATTATSAATTLTSAAISSSSRNTNTNKDDGLGFLGQVVQLTDTAASGNSGSGSGNSGSGGAGPAISEDDDEHATSKGHSAESQPFFALVRGLLRQRNFVVFTINNAFQTFMCSFSTNLFPIFTAALVQQTLGARTVTAMMGLSFLLPNLINIVLLQPLAMRVGAHAVSLYVLIFRFGTASVFLMLFYRTISDWSVPVFSAALMAGYILMNRIATECNCRLFSLVSTDVTDEDEVLNGIGMSRAGSIMGIEALLTKPGQSLAPVLGWAMLSHLGAGAGSAPAVPSAVYSAGAASFAAMSNTIVQAGKSDLIEQIADGTLTSGASSVALDVRGSTVLFLLLLVTSFLVSLIQIGLWSWGFTLKGTYLASIRRRMRAQNQKTETHSDDSASTEKSTIAV